MILLTKRRCRLCKGRAVGDRIKLTQTQIRRGIRKDLCKSDDHFWQFFLNKVEGSAFNTALSPRLAASSASRLLLRLGMGIGPGGG